MSLWDILSNEEREQYKGEIFLTRPIIITSDDYEIEDDYSDIAPEELDYRVKSIDNEDIYSKLYRFTLMLEEAEQNYNDRIGGYFSSYSEEWLHIKIAIDILGEAGAYTLPLLRDLVIHYKDNELKSLALQKLLKNGISAVPYVITLIPMKDYLYELIRFLIIHEEKASTVITSELENLKTHAEKPAALAIIEVIKSLSNPELSLLDSYLSDNDDADLRIGAITAISYHPQTGYKKLYSFLLDIDIETRSIIVSTLAEKFYDGLARQKLLAIAVEDPIGNIATTALNGLCRNIKDNLTETDQLITFIYDELIIRAASNPEERFNPKNIAQLLSYSFRARPQSERKILLRCIEDVYELRNHQWERIVDIAKILFLEDFSVAVKEKSSYSPTNALVIMDRIGGVEATSYFSKHNLQKLEKYQKPLDEIENIALERWNSLTKQSKTNLWINVCLSIGAFLLGTTATVWGLLLVSNSSAVAQQVTGGVLAGISALITTFSGKFWKEPAEHIRTYSNQQFRLQIAFIGLFERLTKLRLQFEQDYLANNLSNEGAELYQKQISEAIEQAARIAGVDLPNPQLESKGSK